MSRRIAAIMQRCGTTVCCASLALSICNSTFAHDCLRRRLRLLGASSLQALQHTHYGTQPLGRNAGARRAFAWGVVCMYIIQCHVPSNTVDSASSQSTNFQDRWTANRSSYQVTETFLLDAPLFVLPVQLPVERLQMQLHDIPHHDRQPGRRDADGIRVAVRGAPRARPDI